MSIEQAIVDIQQHYLTSSTQRIWVALSGGIDSVVLLYGLIRQADSLPSITAIHVNHQLSPLANQWQQFCQSLCDQLSVPLEIAQAQVSSSGEGWEAAARRQRYTIFEHYVGSHDYLLTAHHQRDQAETVLLQLMRGAGVEGLAGMPVKRPLQTGYLLRPLLNVSEQVISDYASYHQLSWVEDPSNDDIQLRRNFIRHQVLPVLESVWPATESVLYQTSERMQQTGEFLREVSQKDHHLVALAEDQLDLTVLRQWSEARRYHYMYYWLKHKQDIAVTHRQLQTILQEVVEASDDANPCFQLNDTNQLRRFQAILYLVPRRREVDTQAITIHWPESQQKLDLPYDLGSLELIKHTGSGLKLQPSDELMVCFRQGGEALYLPHRHGQKSLKKLFQEWQVPPWQRHRIPLLYVNNQLAAVVGYAIAHQFYTVSHGHIVQFL